MSSPDTWTLDDARQRIEKPSWLAAHRAFVEGDHLHAGAGNTVAGLALGGLAGWIAPMPPQDHALYKSYYDGVVRGFVSSNKVGEVVGRHRAGVVGRQPSRGFESKEPLADGVQMSAEMLKLKQQADAWAAERWEAEGMHTALQDAVTALLYAGRQPARLLLPRGFLEKGQDGAWKIPRVSLPQMLKMIRLTYPKPEECTVYVDPDTFEEVGVFTYMRDGEYRAEVTWVDRSSATVDRPGLTVVRVIGEAGTLDQRTYDFGGLIPMFEMRRHPLVTPQMIQNQKALNLALSSVPRNVWTAGARARALFNVNPPGKDVVDADGNVVRIHEPMDWGASTVNFLQGAPIEDAEGNITGYANPSMQVEEPVEVRPSKEAVDIHAWEIHSEARQLHAITGTDSAASGLKLLVARVDYLGSLTETKPTVDACLEWQMNARQAMAEAFTGGREGVRLNHPYTGLLRANAECKLDAGPITPEERNALNELRKDGIYSKETIRILMGTEDASEEEAKVLAENRADRAFDLIAKADAVPMDRYAVLTILGGFAPEEARALARGDVTAGGLTQ